MTQIKTPLLIRAVLTGIAVTSMGTLPWAFLASLNLKYFPDLPWAAVITAGYLWFYWKYLRGWGWPQATSAARHRNCRALNLPDDVWPAAIGAGILGLWSLLFFQSFYGRMVNLPSSSEDLSHVPTFTLFISLIISAVVAGISEESGLRGYMQGPLEERYGPVTAIMVTATSFGFLHFTHREFTLALMPWYMGVGLVYGMLAYLTKSIMPSVVLHAGGNMLGALQLVLSGRAEWQAPSATSQLIWETGPDASFWISFLGFVVVAAAASWAYTGLARITRIIRKVVS
jgi:membrane protease YdiL (CAAX protease family)